MEEKKVSQAFSSPVRAYYCYSTTADCIYSEHYVIKLSLQNLYCLFSLMHYNISVSLWIKKKAVIALLHRSPWKWIFKCKSPTTFPFPTLHPSHPDLIWTGTSLQPCLLVPSLCGEMEKHKSTFWDSSQEKTGSLDHTIIRRTWFTLVNFPKIIEVLYIASCSFFNRYNHGA